MFIEYSIWINYKRCNYIMVKISVNDIELARKFNFYKNNPQKFFEECCMLPMGGGDELVILHDPQKKIVEDFYKGDVHDMIFLKSRQIGFSTLFQLICVHLVIFYKNVVIGVTSRSGDEASDFCRKVKDIIDKLPEWIRPEY